ncbi:hypothetical protein COV16_01415 [Candidatus Woesearchaeota archaeon CG10_big_fil_rev_8_21_14_0_10_34_8]|jgi:hypothetical protein|nr:MAG: hypothetical protein COV16_01415 [Candidatus Woesearchaeota archaeon CG10_big_fil_rev_8_21_14_0_10_34_8]
MEKLPLDRLFTKKLELSRQKYKQIYIIFYSKKNYFSVYHAVIYLRDIIKQEIFLNKRIIKKIHRIYKRKTKEEHIFYELAETTNDLLETLQDELDILKEVGIISIIKNKIIFYKKHSFLRKKCLDFKKVFDKEQEINKNLTQQLYDKNMELYGLKASKKKNLKEYMGLLLEAQKLLISFRSSIGNKEKVLKVGKDLLKVLDKVQNTDLYEFVQQDVNAIKNKVKFVMAHPKQHKLTYLFTSFYIISPGTFELTGAILAVRYMTKYTIKKTKNIKSFSKDNSIRRRIKKRIKSKFK